MSRPAPPCLRLILWLNLLLVWLSANARPAVDVENQATESIQKTDSGGAVEAAENADNYADRLRLMQEWLRSRREQREHNWGRDVISPQPDSVDDDEAEEFDAGHGSEYFLRRGLDERGYRRLDGNVRVRIRGLQDEKAHIIELDQQSGGSAEKDGTESGTYPADGADLRSGGESPPSAATRGHKGQADRNTAVGASKPAHRAISRRNRPGSSARSSKRGGR